MYICTLLLLDKWFLRNFTASFLVGFMEAVCSDNSVPNLRLGVYGSSRLAKSSAHCDEDSVVWNTWAEWILSVLNQVIEFGDLDKPKVRFLRQVLSTLLVRIDDDDINDIFGR